MNGWADGNKESWTTFATLSGFTPRGALSVFDSAFDANDHAATIGPTLASSLRPSRKQVLWLIAPDSAKVHWLHAASEQPYEGYLSEWPNQNEEDAAEACRELPASLRTPECHRNYKIPEP